MSPPEDDDGHSFDGVAAEARFDDADQENSTESKYGVSRNLVPLKVVMTVSFALVMVVCSTCCIVVTMNFFSQSATARNTELGTAVATRTATGINHNLNLPLTKLESWMQIWRYEHERNGVVYTSTSTLTNDDVLYWEEMVLDSFAWGRSHAVISHVGLCTASGAYLHATQDTALSTTTIRLSRPPLEDTEVMYDGALQKQYEYSPAGNYSCRDAVFFQDVLASLTSPLFEPTMVQIKPGPEKDGQHVQYTTAMVVPGAKGMEVLAVAYMAYDVAVIPAFVERIAKSTEGLVISVVHADRTLLAVSASPGEALEGTAEEMCCHVLSGTRVTAPVPLAMLNINVCVNILSDGKKDMDEVLEVALLASCGVFAAFVAFCFVFSHVLFLPLKDVRNRLLAIARIEIPSPARGSMFVEVNALQSSCNTLAEHVQQLIPFLPDSTHVAPEEATAAGPHHGVSLQRQGRVLDRSKGMRQLTRRNVSVVVLGYDELDTLAAHGETETVMHAHLAWFSQLVAEAHRASGLIHRTLEMTVSVKFNSTGRSGGHQRLAAQYITTCLQLWSDLDVTIGASSGHAAVGCLGGYNRLGYVVLGRVLEEAEVMRHLCPLRRCQSLVMRSVAIYAGSARAIDRVCFGMETTYSTVFEIFASTTAAGVDAAYLEMWDMLLDDRPCESAQALKFIAHDLDAGVKSAVCLADRISAAQDTRTLGTHIHQGVATE